MTQSLLERLYQAAENESVEIVPRVMKENESFIIEYNDRYFIAVSKDTENQAKLTSVLSHELGHYYTGYLYSADTPLQTRGRCEYRANAWAYKAICPVERIKEAIKNNGENLWEIAEYLGLPEEFAAAAIEYYKGKGAF